MFNWIILSGLAILSIMVITLKVAGKGSEHEVSEDIWSSEN